MISALGHAVCRPHNKKGPRACRAVYSFSKVSSVWEEPWSATLFLYITHVFTKTKFALCAVFLICNRLTVCTGVLHGAVVLITELCERNPDTLDQFRKVIFSKTYTLTNHRYTDHLWYVLPFTLGCSWTGSDHERSCDIQLFSRTQCSWYQRSIFAGLSASVKLNITLY